MYPAYYAGDMFLILTCYPLRVFLILLQIPCIYLTHRLQETFQSSPGHYCMWKVLEEPSFYVQQHSYEIFFKSSGLWKAGDMGLLHPWAGGRCGFHGVVTVPELTEREKVLQELSVTGFIPWVQAPNVIVSLYDYMTLLPREPRRTRFCLNEM